MGIVIFGASGAGSTTLGKSVAQRLNFQYLDIDDYLWCWKTKIPYTVVRSQEERTKDLMNDIQMYPNFVIAGTIFSDKELFNPLFDLAVFITTPAEICAERVYKREFARWGKRILPKGDMYRATRFHGDFDDYISNAQRYETANESKFGRKLHEMWVSELPCPVLHLDGTESIIENTMRVVEQFLQIISAHTLREKDVI